MLIQVGIYTVCTYLESLFYICVHIGEKWHTGAMVAFESTAKEDEGQQKYK